MTDEPESKTNWTTYAFAILTIVVGFLGAPLLFAGSVLLWSAATALGKLSGLACVLLAAAIQPITWRRRLVGAAIAIATVGCLGYVIASRTSSGGDASAAVHVVGRQPSSISPARWVAEIDQVFVASTLLPWFSDVDASAMPRLRDDVRSVYGEFDDAFVSVPSLLGDAVANECTGRAFVWDVPTPSAAPARELLFVHAYGGSWTGHLRVLRPVATALGASIVQPSCGIGLWKTERELETFERFVVVPDVSEAVRPELHVVALANGGLAVSRRLEAVLERATSIVLIAPFFDFEAIERVTRTSRRVPVLVLQGDADDRVPMEHVEAGIERLRRLHLDVRLRVLEGADHYAFFHDRERIRRELSEFYDAIDRPRGH